MLCPGESWRGSGGECQRTASSTSPSLTSSHRGPASLGTLWCCLWWRVFRHLGTGRGSELLSIGMREKRRNIRFSGMPRQGRRRSPTFAADRAKGRLAFGLTDSPSQKLIQSAKCCGTWRTLTPLTGLLRLLEVEVLIDPLLRGGRSGGGWCAEGEARASSRPRGVEGRGLWLMDDGLVLEPLVGNRVYHSLACLDRTMVAVWGKEGVNVEKMAEEGTRQPRRSPATIAGGCGVCPILVNCLP